MIFLSSIVHFFSWSWLLNNFNKISMKNLCQKIFSPCFYYLKCFAKLKHDILSNKTHFYGWPRLLNNFNKISMIKFLLGNIFSHCFQSEMFFRAPKWNILLIKSILLAGHDCWKSLLKSQLYRAVLISCLAKNS